MINRPTDRLFFNIDNDRVILMGGILDGKVYYTKKGIAVIHFPYAPDNYGRLFFDLSYKRIAETNIFRIVENDHGVH